MGERNAHQWRPVRYLYLDFRREARQHGIVIRGPRKVFDSSVAHIDFLYASERGDFRPYHQQIFARFWRRELAIKRIGEASAILPRSSGKERSATSVIGRRADA